MFCNFSICSIMDVNKCHYMGQRCNATLFFFVQPNATVTQQLLWTTTIASMQQREIRTSDTIQFTSREIYTTEHNSSFQLNENHATRRDLFWSRFLWLATLQAPRFWKLVLPFYTLSTSWPATCAYGQTDSFRDSPDPIIRPCRVPILIPDCPAGAHCQALSVRNSLCKGLRTSGYLQHAGRSVEQPDKYHPEDFVVSMHLLSFCKLAGVLQLLEARLSPLWEAWR